MRALWGGFALGVFGLQQQAVLPGWGGWLGLTCAMVAAAGWAFWALTRPGAWRRASGWLALWLAAACVGFGYAAWRAELRLAEALPYDWQSRDIEVTGHIAKLPV
jgi:competence protein ComEC